MSSRRYRNKKKKPQPKLVLEPVLRATMLAKLAKLEDKKKAEDDNT